MNLVTLVDLYFINHNTSYMHLKTAYMCICISILFVHTVFGVLLQALNNKTSAPH